MTGPVERVRLHPPEAVLWIARTLAKAGFEVWAVGGAVRDALTGIQPGDWDLTTSAKPNEVRSLFRRTAPIGIEHGTVGVIARDGVMYEVTTFRRDVETFGRKARVAFADTIEEDLSRRDFTMNAVAWNPLTGEVRDPYGGVDDLAAGILRTVGEAERRFAEDRLRVLRALRFAGQFALRIDPDTWRALTAASDRLDNLSAERIREELLKVLAKQPRPSATLRLYATSGVLGSLYPELAACLGVQAPRAAGGAGERAVEPPAEGADAGQGEVQGKVQGKVQGEVQGEGQGQSQGQGEGEEVAAGAGGSDLWSYLVRAVDAVPASHWRVRLAALLHAVALANGSRGHSSRPADPGDSDDGAPEPGPESASASSGRPAAAGYAARAAEGRGAEAPPTSTNATRSAAIARRLLRRLRMSNADVDRVTHLVAQHEPIPEPDASDPELRRWVRRVGRDHLNDLFRLRIAILRAGGGSGAAARCLARLRSRTSALLRSAPALTLGDLALDGSDLRAVGIPPGPTYGEILRDLLERVTDDPALNERERLLQIVQAGLSERDD